MDVGTYSPVHSCMPDGKGGWQPVPTIQTAEEAVRYLRIDTLQVKNPMDTLNRLIELGHLRPTPIGGTNFFMTEELDRCARERTEWRFDGRKPKKRQRSLT